MRIFLDANVLVSILNKEYPAFSACSKVLSLADRSEFTLYVSSLSLGIAWYFAGKKHGDKMARQKIDLILPHISIANCGEKEVKAALALKKADDFEDAMQYFSALHSDCERIITSNTSDYHFSQIGILEPEFFLGTINP